jgi:hypothetical protein
VLSAYLSPDSHVSTSPANGFDSYEEEPAIQFAYRAQSF